MSKKRTKKLAHLADNDGFAEFAALLNAKMPPLPHESEKDYYDRARNHILIHDKRT